MTENHSEDADSSEERRLIQATMQDIYSLGSTAHLLTFAAVAVLEERNAPEEIINPRQVKPIRTEISGQTRTQTAVRNSMNRLKDQGLIKRTNIESEESWNQHDWSVAPRGWRLLRVTNGIHVIRDIAQLDPDADSEAYERRAEPLREALADIQELGSTSHLITLVTIGVLEERGVSPINVPRIARNRRALIGKDQTQRTTYHSVDELAERGFVYKEDIAPKSDRLRLDVRLTERAWRLLQSTQMIALVREYAHVGHTEGEGEGEGD